jgi:hypothetical protein
MPLALILSALASEGVHAGEWGVPKDCPPPSYCRWHYWTPTVYRVYACLCGPKIDHYANVNCSAELMAFKIAQFHCPAVDPITFYLQAPYGLPPSSANAPSTSPPKGEK